MRRVAEESVEKGPGEDFEDVTDYVLLACLRPPEVGWEKDVVLSIYADKAHAKNDTERLLERVINIGSEELWHGDCTCAFPVPGGSGKYYYKIEEHDLEKKPYVESEE